MRSSPWSLFRVKRHGEYAVTDTVVPVRENTGSNITDRHFVQTWSEKSVSSVFLSKNGLANRSHDETHEDWDAP